MADFLDRARDWMDSETGRGDREVFQRVFGLISELQSIQSKATARLRDVEEVLALFEMGVLFDRIGTRDGQAASRAVDDMKHLIVRTIEASMRFPYDSGQVRPTDTYRQFGDLIGRLIKRGESVAILSFNYDVGVDYGLTWNSVPIYYGLNDKEAARPNHANVLKLHGAINLGRCRDCKSIDAVHVNEWVSGRIWPGPASCRTVELPVGSTMGACRQCGGLREAFIVPPTWNKGQHYEKIGITWRHAAAHLRDAEYIIVIGYSWPRTDRFFQYLYALGTVGPTLLRRFWLIDPAERDSELADRYREMLGEHARDRFEHTAQRFQFSLNDIACELGLGNIFGGAQGKPRVSPWEVA